MFFIHTVRTFLDKSWAIPASIFLAFVVSYFFPNFSKSISSFGDLYLSFFLLAIIPYLSVSIILATCDLFAESTSSLNMKKWFFTYLILYLVIAFSGILIASLLNLGGEIAQYGEVAEFVRNSQVSNLKEISLDSPLDLESKEGIITFLVQSVPDNIFSALSKGTIVQIIVFSIFFGIALGLIPKQRKDFIVQVIDNIVEPFRKFIDAAILCLPIGIFFIMSKYISEIKDPTIIFYLWKFILFTILGIVFLSFLGSIVVWRKLKIPYVESIMVIKKASIIALSTSDSFPALPSLLEGVQEKTKLNKDSLALLIPMGIALFEFGAIFYYCFLTVFVAQIYNVQLDVNAFIIILVSAYFAAAAETQIPLSSLSIIFVPLGLPVIFITLFMVLIDWVTDPFRSFFTVMMNYTGSVIVADLDDSSTGVKE